MEIFLITNLKFWYTIAVIFILGRVIYYVNNGKREYLFTYFMLAAIIFLVCILVSRVELGLGFAIGIFAIFGIIRYRTNPIPIREMTYIFLSAGIAAKNSLIPLDQPFYKILTTDLSLLLLAGLLEYFLFRAKTKTKDLVYSNLELIHPEKRDLLYQDLQMKYGIKDIEKIKIGKIDEVKSSVRLLIYFRDSDGSNLQEE